MSDLISREVLLNAVKEIQKQRKGCEPQSGSIINLITNAPAIEQGEAVGFVRAERNPLNTTDKNGNVCMVLHAYLRGDKAKDGDLLYTAPQQPQEQVELVRKAVADALEEAAVITWSNCMDYMKKHGKAALQDKDLYKFVDDIRALIKRNAEGVE